MEEKSPPKSEIEAIVRSNQKLIAELELFDPIRTVSALSGLMLFPELQSTSYRLETLTHIAMAVCSGKKKPKAKDLARWFHEIGEGYCGMQEDPAEDVFVFNILTPRGNFLVLEGLWEGGGFNLQHVVNTVEAMPKGTGYDVIREAVYSLLILSNAVCTRAGLSRYKAGSDLKLSKLPPKIRDRFFAYRSFVKFTEDEVAELGLSAESLGEFGFVPNHRHRLIEQSISFSELERHPVCFKNDHYYLMLPNAVSSAIRRYVFEKMTAADMRENFVRSLAQEYAKTFSSTPILGWKMGAQFLFQKTPGGLIAEISTEVDTGHHLHIVIKMDELSGFENEGLSGFYKFEEAEENYIEKRTKEFRDKARQKADYKDGISLVITSGIGRGFYFSLPMQHDDWRVMGLSAYDFHTLSWLDKFKPLSLWRLNEAQEKVAASGVTLMNINGLLNLVAWKDSLDGHLVPHDQLPDDYVGDGQMMIMVNQNSIRELREKVLNYHDFHNLPGPDSELIRVCKLTDSIFEEDLKKPIYVADFFIGDGLPISYFGEYSLWWGVLFVEDKKQSETRYERWKLVCAWLPRIASRFESQFKNNLPEQINIELHCETTFGSSRDRPDRLSFEEAREEVSYVVDQGFDTVKVFTTRRFEDAFYHPENIAERALVEAAVSGISELLTDISADDQKKLFDKIIESVYARQTHAFEATRFRDFVRPVLSSAPTRIDNDDIATMKFGLGWRVRDRKLGGDVDGKKECLELLNSLVSMLENELCELLSGFDRQQLAELVLENHEISEYDRRTWRSTSAAVLALHEDKQAALAEIVDHEGRLNAIFQASRILIEIIPHECPLQGGHRPSKFELSKMMARVMEIISLGGWSDAIRWDAMEPKIKVTPLGDVYGNLDFFDNVVDQFGRSANERTVKGAVEKYEKQFEQSKIVEEVPDEIEEEFVEAFEEEFGIALKDVRMFNDRCENAFIEKGWSFKTLRKSEAIKLFCNCEELSAKIVEQIIDTFTLDVRESWKTIPEGFVDADRQPWRFRRRLSILRKPFVALDDQDDTLLMIAPGVIRDALAYTVGNLYSADFADNQILSKKMRKWVGKSRGSREKFNAEVADKLHELGWKVKSDLNVTELIGKGTDEKFGDIQQFGDVDVLAWSEVSEEVLIIECKDLQYKKTPGEIAEQLSKFRGELSSVGKPDLLLKHLNRVAISNAHKLEITKYTGLKSVSIKGYLMFRNPVPMQYAGETIAAKTELLLFDEIDAKLKL